MRIFTALACTAALCASAQATVISGQVTGGSALTNGGTFIILDLPFTDSTPDNTVGNNNFQNPNVYAFDEEQNVDSGMVGIMTDVGMNVAPNAVVASHYIVFDPAVSRSVTAIITFDAPVVGIATQTATLAASDFLANTGVTYLNPGLRGLENVDSVSVVMGDPNSIMIDFTASSPGDSIRVFTEFSPGAEIPVPAGVWLFGSGAAMLASRMRRRKAVS
ncbi:MAG: hypothetical protein AAGH41_03810 [Pseudomonadota bacterium]